MVNSILMQVTKAVETILLYSKILAKVYGASLCSTNDLTAILGIRAVLQQ